MGFILTEKTKEYYKKEGKPILDKDGKPISPGTGLSIEYLFNKRKEKQPNGTTYLWFAEAVEGKGFSRGSLRKAFKKLVSPDDYGDGEGEDTFEFLVSLTLGIPHVVRPHRGPKMKF